MPSSPYECTPRREQRSEGEKRSPQESASPSPSRTAHWRGGGEAGPDHEDTGTTTKDSAVWKD